MRPASLAFLMSLWVAAPAWADRLYRGGAVAAAHPAASQAGVEMLDKGGNAVDAAVAAAFVMAVVGPYHSGLGGGGFALTWSAATQQATVLDFREVAPAAARSDLFVREGKVVEALSTDGPLAVAVPGAVKGYLALHAKGGKLKREVVLAPALRLAREGFWVSPKYRAMAEGRAECLRRDADAARIFLRPDAQGVPNAPAVGTVLRQPELTRTLERLSKSGEAAFYAGPIAQALVASAGAAAGGLLTLDDVKAFAVRERAPLEGAYRGHRILTMPPPSAGGTVLLQALGILERAGALGPSSREVKTLHTTIEALRRAYVDRALHLGDPRFMPTPVEQLLTPAHLDAMAASIDPKKATASLSLLNLEAAAPKASEPKRNTTHLSVIDREGNAVALTTTVNGPFGSCVVAKGTGVLLNNQMDDFSAQPGAPNAYGLVSNEVNGIAGGKIPLSSMTPTLVFAKEDPKRVELAVGSPGGSTIPTTVLQVISHVIDGKLDVVRAVGQGRLHHQYLPDVVMVDPLAADPLTEKALEALGHTLKRVDRWGDAEAVYRDPLTGLTSAGSDPRNEGAPAGQD